MTMDEWTLTQTFKFDQRIVRYDVWGEGAPVVVVHGTPWSSYNMRHLIRGLADSYQVHFYDLIGYGQSDRFNGRVSLAIQNELLDALLTHWGLSNPLIIGHDFGGATVLRTCLINRRNFEKIVLIDPVAVSPWGSPFFKHVQKHEAAFAGVPDYIHRAVVEAYIQTAAYQPIDLGTLEATLRPWLSQDGKGAFYRQIAQASSVYTEEVQGRYGEINRPVLILWGAEDEWIPLSQGEELNRLIHRSQLEIIPDAGHLVIEEKPDQLLDHIRVFLK